MASIRPLKDAKRGVNPPLAASHPHRGCVAGRDPLRMLKNPVIVCLALAAIVAVAVVAEAVVVLTTRRRRIAW